MAEHQMQHINEYQANTLNVVEHGLFVAQQHVDLKCNPDCGLYTHGP